MRTKSWSEPIMQRTDAAVAYATEIGKALPARPRSEGALCLVSARRTAGYLSTDQMLLGKKPDSLAIALEKMSK